MAIRLKLSDDQFPDGKMIPHAREIVRGIVFTNDGKVLIHEIARDDIFGRLSYFETPGGGVEKGEGLLEALHREIREETGYEVEILANLGLVKDEYRLINRTNYNHYFLCETIGEKKPNHLVSEGDSLILATHELSLDEVISLYEDLPGAGIALLLKRRELPILLEARKEKYLALLGKRSLHPAKKG